ncbi:MAG: hypothetical protein ACTSXK_06225 [Promethearchaeota archaeon]
MQYKSHSMFSIKAIFRYQLPVIIAFLCFLTLFYANEYHQIETNYKDPNSGIVDFASFDESLYSPLYNQSFSDKFLQLQNQLPNSNVILMQKSNDLYFFNPLYSIQNVSYGFNFKGVFCNNISSLLDSKLGRTGIKLVEGNLPLQKNDIIINEQMKPSGNYTINQTIPISVYQSLFEPLGKENISLRITGFYKIEDYTFMENLLAIHEEFHNITDDGSDTSFISDKLHPSSSFFYFFGSSELGKYYYQKYQKQNLSYEYFVPTNFPFYTKILIINPSHISKSYKEISKEIKIIYNFIEDVNERNLSRFTNFQFSQNIDDNDLHESKLLVNPNEVNFWGKYSSYYFIQQSLIHLRGDIVLISIPILFFLTILINISNKEVIRKKLTEIENFYTMGKEISKLRNKIAISIFIKLFLLISGIIIGYYLVFLFIPNGAIIISDTLISISIILETIPFINFFVFQKNFRTIVTDKIDDLYQEFQEDFELLEVIKKKKRKKQHKNIFFLLLLSFLPVIYLVLFNTPIMNGSSFFVDNFGKLANVLFILLSVPIIFIIPYLLVKFIFPMIPKIQGQLFGNLTSHKKLKNVYRKLIKSKPSFSQTQTHLLVLMIVLICLSSTFITFKFNKERMETNLDWGKTNCKINIQSYGMAGNFSITQNKIRSYFVNDSHHIFSDFNFIFTGDGILQFDDIENPVKDSQSSHIKIVDQNYYKFIENENNVNLIRVSSMEADIKNISMLFEKLQSPNSILVSDTLARSIPIIVGNQISVNTGYGKKYDYRVIGIIKSAPFLKIDDPINRNFALLGLNSRSIQTIRSTSIYIKMNTNKLNVTSYVLNNVSTDSNFSVDSLSFKPESNFNPYFLDKLIYLEGIMLSAIILIQLKFTYSNIIVKRKKEKEKFFAMGLEQKEATNLILNEIFSYLTILSTIAIIISILLMYYLHLLFLFLSNANMDQVYYTGFFSLLNNLLLFFGNSSSGLGIPGQSLFVPFTINPILILIPGLLVFFHLSYYLIYKFKEK